MSKLRPVWVSDRFEIRFGLRSKPLECSHDEGEMKLRSTWNSFRSLRSVWVFRSTWNFHVSRNFFRFGAKWILKPIGAMFFYVQERFCEMRMCRVSELNSNRFENFHVRGRQISRHYPDLKLRPVWVCSCEGSLKDPVLPKILHGLTVTFILYESRFGLAIVKLYCLFNLQMNVVMPSLLNSNNRHSWK